ncbi:MAG: 23S rRNA (adenine(2503)-C(2))-methyltransferase RlmN [Deltaproteobacteria bacterium]|nr:23S rRNA (adenine(2503)-C(2))-methyltransferase RlmN [Deltaproteobacteria bacterium]
MTTAAHEHNAPGAAERAAAPHVLGQTQAALELWAVTQGATREAAKVLARTLLNESADRAPKPGDATPAKKLLAAAHAHFARALPAFEAVVDPDGTVRFAVALDDGAIIETVLIHQGQSEQRVRERLTICVSSQVGCARGCTFCETGRTGLKRNLQAHEIVAQVVLARRAAASQGLPAPQNVVFMGMGEPLDNLDEVLLAIDVLKEHHGLAIPERRITVSTVGIVPKLPELYARTKANLALSLHALEPAVRKALLPVAKKWSVETLREALARAPRPVLLQWTLIAGHNDADADADRLLEFARGLDVRVNLIPLNPGPDASQHAPAAERCRAFQKRLLDGGLRTMLRLPHGQTVGGACGQLAGARRAGR